MEISVGDNIFNFVQYKAKKQREDAALRYAIFAAVCAFAVFLGTPAAAEWIKDERTGCAVWKQDPRPNESVTWSGACEGGRASGDGVLQWYKEGKPIGRYEGEYHDGKRHGRGICTVRGTNFTCRYANDKRIR